MITYKLLIASFSIDQTDLFSICIQIENNYYHPSIDWRNDIFST